MKNSDQHPPPHAKYIVRRNGLLYTATPCYGLHNPWWVVRLMGDFFGPDGKYHQDQFEATPIEMRDSDEWWPIDEFMAACPLLAGETPAWELVDPDGAPGERL